MVRWDDLRREPFRIFFPLATVLGLLGVNHWLIYALGWSSSYSGAYHAGMQVGGYMLGFITGFLLTALPRFAAAEPATTGELILMLTLFLAQSLLLSSGRWMAAQASFAALLVALAVFAGRRFAQRRSGVGPPAEFIWILLAILQGLIGSGLLIGVQAGWFPVWLLRVGRPMAQQGFLLSIVIGVGGFMAPRLLGRGYLLVNPAGVSEQQARWIRWQRVRLHLLAGAALVVSFVVEGAGAVSLAYGLRAAVVTAEFAWTAQFYRPPSTQERYVTFLWLSLWMILIGLWGPVVAPRYRVAMLHAAFIGGFSLMAFAVATMVVLSHGGRGGELRQPLRVLKTVGAGIALAVIARLAADLQPTLFFQWLGVAAACWSLAALGWLCFSLPHITRRVPSGTFERAHDEVKRQVAPSAAVSQRP